MAEFNIPGAWHSEVSETSEEVETNIGIVVQSQDDNSNDGIEFIPKPTTLPAPREGFPYNYNPYEFASPTIKQLHVPEPTTKRPIVIAIFGQTGTGKTSFVKAATGQDLEIGHNLNSCTQEVLPFAFQIESQVVLLVDTPGFSDTNLSDTEVLSRIAAWMKDTYDEGVLLSGIIYLHRIIDTRMDGPSLKNLRMMKNLCGARSLQNVVLATTMWENVSLEDGSRRELELKNKFWKEMIAGGSAVARIETNTREVAINLVKSLLKNKPRATQLQQELHDGKALSETCAGTAISEEIAKVEVKLRAELQESLREIEAYRKRVFIIIILFV